MGHFKGLLHSLSALAFIVVAASASAQDKTLNGVALVIGQSAYEHLEPLANPENDAEAIGDLLDDLGFDVRSVSDRDAERLGRELDRFVEDAEFADVALLYYSGHGIEAGGENWLVPVDADLSALDAASEHLVPLSGVLQELRESVPVTIVLLDACRTNPFPPDARIRIDPDSEPVAIAAAGLGAPKGSLGTSRRSAADLGSVIGFAAEPGQEALDGSDGGNSPYAAALLRHFSAIDGAEFGTVMRMVTEEVYLKTRSQQRPWVNESLRRLLYFGNVVETEAETGDAGLITRERRQLLLTIAELPSPQRRRVEAIARTDGVPLDAIYAVFTALGQKDLPDDPATVDRMLRQQAETIRTINQQQAALSSDDPEIVRLASLADQAINDGALASARQFLDQAVARVEQTRETLDQVEAQLEARRLADAEIYARRAATAMLGQDFSAAAADYAEAFDLAVRWDRKVAQRYKRMEGVAWASIGQIDGDNDALRKAIELYEASRGLVPREDDESAWAGATHDLAVVQSALGQFADDTAMLASAAQTLRSLLTVWTREADPRRWALAQLGLGATLARLGQRSTDPAVLEEAVAASRGALEVWDSEDDETLWSKAMVNLGLTLVFMDQWTQDTARLKEAVSILTEVIESGSLEAIPFDWASARGNLGSALLEIGRREGNVAALERARGTLRSVIERDGVPRQALALANDNPGLVLTLLGAQTNNRDLFETAIAHHQAALEIWDRESAPRYWSMAEQHFGNSLTNIGLMEGDLDKIDQGVERLQRALEELSLDSDPASWARVKLDIGLAMVTLAQQRSEPGLWHDAADVLEESLAVYEPGQFPTHWAVAEFNRGAALLSAAYDQPDVATLENAALAFRSLLSRRGEDGVNLNWFLVQSKLGVSLLFLGELTESAETIRDARQVIVDARSEQASARSSDSIALLDQLLQTADKLLEQR